MHSVCFQIGCGSYKSYVYLIIFCKLYVSSLTVISVGRWWKRHLAVWNSVKKFAEEQWLADELQSIEIHFFLILTMRSISPSKFAMELHREPSGTEFNKKKIGSRILFGNFWTISLFWLHCNVIQREHFPIFCHSKLACSAAFGHVKDIFLIASKWFFCSKSTQFAKGHERNVGT